MFLRNKIVSKVIQFYPWAEDTADWRPVPTPASTKMPDWYKKLHVQSSLERKEGQ